MTRLSQHAVEIVRRARQVLPFLPRALALVHEAAGARAWWWLALLALQGLLPVAMVYLVRALVDALVLALGSGGDWHDLRGPLVLAAALALLMVATEVLRALTRWLRTTQAELVSDHVRSLVHERAIRADLARYESQDYFDMMHRARVDAIFRPAALLENLGTLLQNSITLVAMAGVLLSLGWWLPLALVASTAPALAVVVRHALRHHRWRMATTQDERRTMYYDQVMTGREAAQELRLFDLGGHFKALFSTLRERLRGQRLALAGCEARAQVAAGVIGLLLMAGALAWMLVRCARGSLSLGGLAMFYQAFSQGQQLMRSLLETVGQIYANGLFLTNLFEFLAIEPEITARVETAASAPTVGPAIRFQNVAFTYPGGTRPVFEDLSLAVQPGAVVALLGRNGAGKSTLFKLLCRFYDPASGTIEIDGEDITTIDPDALRRAICVLFQEPMHFATTVRDNIAYGDLEAAHDPHRIEHAARDAGAGRLVASLPHGLDTELGRWFGGTELSVGEWQRVALARAFMRDARIVLLDEPTSAMDSWSEAEWLDRCLEHVAGRTTLIITHRLTTAMRAHQIHVMESGRIVESGTHEQLVAGDGPYGRAWAAQSRP